VSAAVVEAFQGGIAEGLFLSMTELRRRQTAAAIRRVRQHPMFGAATVGLSDAALDERLTFGRRLFSRIFGRKQVSLDARMAVEWGAGMALFGRTMDEAIEKVRHGLHAKTASEVGIPDEFAEELRRSVFPDA
jgi:hypothetical protein